MSASRVIRSELVIPRAQLKSQNYWRAGLYLKWTTPTTSHHNSLFRVWNFLFLHLQLQSANNAPEGKTNQTYHKNREEETTCLPNSWINDFHSLYWGWIRLRFHDESASRNRAGIAKQSSSHIPLLENTITMGEPAITTVSRRSTRLFEEEQGATMGSSGSRRYSSCDDKCKDKLQRDSRGSSASAEARSIPMVDLGMDMNGLFPKTVDEMGQQSN